jgi:signal transduction histidine kinase
MFNEILNTWFGASKNGRPKPWEEKCDSPYDPITTAIINDESVEPFIEEEKHRRHNWMYREFQRLQNSLVNVGTMIREGELGQLVAFVVNKAIPHIRAAVNPVSDLITQANEKIEKGAQQIKAYRKKNHIFRMMQEPTPTVTWIAFFTGFFTLETAIGGASFLGTGNFPSPYDALLFAAGVALVNVQLSGWALGYGVLRNWHHSSFKVRFVSKLMAWVIGIILLAIHIGLFMMRLTENIDVLDDFSVAYLMENLEVMDVAASVLIFFIGVLSAACCAWKGCFKIMDPNRELVKMTRDCEVRPREHRAEILEDIEDQAFEVEDETWEEIEQFEQRLNENEKQLRDEKHQWEKANEELAAYGQHMEDGFQTFAEGIRSRLKEHNKPVDDTGWTFTIRPEERALKRDEALVKQAEAFQQRARETLADLRTQLRKVRPEPLETSE